jgi:hypothetical protein
LTAIPGNIILVLTSCLPKTVPHEADEASYRRGKAGRNGSGFVGRGLVGLWTPDKAERAQSYVINFAIVRANLDALQLVSPVD